jgi:branched-chain amino acid transport system permease protein
MSLFFYALMTRLLGAEPMRFPDGFGSDRMIAIGGVAVSTLQISILSIVVVVVIALFWFLKKSRWGIAIRGVGDHEGAALLVGLSPFRTTALVSFLSGGLAAVAGTLIGLNFNAVQPYMGETMMLQGFAVVIIGGLGSIPGALAAGMMLGIVEIFTTAYVSSAYRDAVTFALLLTVLWILPQGILPSASARRV